MVPVDISVDALFKIIAGLVILLILAYARAEKWKAKAETLDDERDSSGWESEALFWRNHFNKEAASAVEEHF